MNENNDYNRIDGYGETPSYGWNEPVWSTEPVSEPEERNGARNAEPAYEPQRESVPVVEPVYREPGWYRSPEPEPASSITEPVTEKKARKKGMSTIGIVALCLVCAIVASIGGAGVTYAVLRNDTVAEAILPTAVPVIGTVSYDGASNDTAANIYELAKQQVVGINTTVTYTTGFFGQTATGSISGTGFIITEDGYIVTNYHVIEDAYEGGLPVNVVMYDETVYEAEIIGFDESNDIALLKIDAAGLVPAQLGDSDSVIVGQTVYAVGNALGTLSYTMTSGIVSALNRTIATETTDSINVFQIDAAINSGNSGGPVYNAAGQVIGVVNAKSGVSGVDGLGFAIPISDVAHIVNQLLENGYVADRAHMGVSISTVTESAASSYNMVVGAYVNVVNEGSAAETAGIRVGDIITAVDGKEVTSSSGLTGIVQTYYAGDEAEITVWRDGEYLTLTIVFDETPEPEETPASQQGSGEQGQGGQPYGYSYGGGDMEDFFRQFFGYGY